MAARALRLETSKYRLEIIVSQELVAQLVSTSLSLVVNIDYKFVG